MTNLTEKVVEIDITGFSSEGQGVGRYEGMAVFVSGVIPGEKVKVKFIKIKKRFATAELLEVLVPSPDRVKPACANYEKCGGCHLQHVAYARQLELKREMVADSLQHIGGLDLSVEPVWGMSDPWRYRNRAQFQVFWQDGVAVIGFFAAKSHKIVTVEDCLLLPADLQEANNVLAGLLTELQLFDITKAIWRLNKAGEAMLMLQGQANRGTLKLLAELFVKAGKEKGTQLISLFWQKQEGALVHIWGKEKICEEIGGSLIAFGPLSFSQVNWQATEKLYGIIEKGAGLGGIEKIFDVYCGVGSIAIFLARKAALVVGIEEMPAAVADALFNAMTNGLKNVDFVAGKAEEVLPDLRQKGELADVIVLDPPRAGCKPAVLLAAGEMAPKKLIYTSCDQGSLARDLRFLCDYGYVVKWVQPVDMFAQTFHVETVVLMSRNEK